MTNRAERRAQAKAQPQPAEVPIRISYHYSAEFVGLAFTRPTTQIALSPQQARDMIAALQDTLDKQQRGEGLNG